jgi:hypothetical protein
MTMATTTKSSSAGIRAEVLRRFHDVMETYAEFETTAAATRERILAAIAARQAALAQPGGAGIYAKKYGAEQLAKAQKELGYISKEWPLPDMTAVRSSCIAALGYNERLAILVVLFHGGSMYQYNGVPPEVARRMFDASSHGRQFWWDVRDKYPYHRIG